MSNELKPCECGGTDISIGYKSPQAYWVECVDCGTATEDHSTLETAVANWNRLTQPTVREVRHD